MKHHLSAWITSSNSNGFLGVGIHRVPSILFQTTLSTLSFGYLPPARVCKSLAKHFLNGF